MTDQGVVILITEMSERMQKMEKNLRDDIRAVDDKVDTIQTDVAVIKTKMEATCNDVKTVQEDLKNHVENHHRTGTQIKVAKMQLWVKVLMAFMATAATIAVAAIEMGWWYP